MNKRSHYAFHCLTLRETMKHSRSTHHGAPMSRQEGNLQQKNRVQVLQCHDETINLPRRPGRTLRSRLERIRDTPRNSNNRQPSQACLYPSHQIVEQPSLGVEIFARSLRSRKKKLRPSADAIPTEYSIYRWSMTCTLSKVLLTMS